MNLAKAMRPAFKHFLIIFSNQNRLSPFIYLMRFNAAPGIDDSLQMGGNMVDGGLTSIDSSDIESTTDHHINELMLILLGKRLLTDNRLIR